jgi:hypothetical protein
MFRQGFEGSVLGIFCQSRLPRCLRRRSWPFGCWDRGFESRLRHGCLLLSSCVVLSRVGIGLCDRLITRPKEFYHVSSKITETSKRRPLPDPWWTAVGKQFRQGSALGIFRRILSCHSRGKAEKPRMASR